MRILRGFPKGVHLSRITGSQIHAVRNATKSRAGCGNDAPRAEKRDPDCKVLALPSELGNPHRTRVPTFPQQRLRRRTNLPKLQNPPNRKGLQILVQNHKTLPQDESFRDSKLQFKTHPRTIMNIGPFDILERLAVRTHTASNFEAAKPVAVLGIERAVKKLKRLQLSWGLQLSTNNSATAFSWSANNTLTPARHAALA